ncbi:MAG: glycosyltransferase, partial [Nanopusillaceae archaeon]
MGVYNWDKEKDVIIQKISNTPADFKVCVKLKNEKELLPDLLSHLSKAGFLSEEIIIFDNMSDDEEFLEYLNKISERFLVIKYSGDHNLVHTKAFIDAYKALAQSCRYFMFLDADEFPFFIDLENGVLKVDNFKNSLIKYLDEIDENYDTFWLIYPEYPDLFIKIPRSIYDRLIWSKPLFKSRNILNNDKFISGKWSTPHINHLINTYLAECKIYPKYLPALLIHYEFKYPQRTVRINTMKILRVKVVQNIINDLTGKVFPMGTKYSNLEKIAKFLVDNKNKILDKLSDIETYNYVNRNISGIEKALSTENIPNTNKIYDAFNSFVKDNKDLLELLTKSKIFYGLPHMSFKENIYLYDILRKKSAYLEYGSGMSTIFAMNFCSNIVSVDNHQEWYETVRSYIAELKKLPFYEKINVYYQFVDTGKAGDWGMPLDESGWKNYHKYVLAPWKIA